MSLDMILQFLGNTYVSLVLGMNCESYQQDEILRLLVESADFLGSSWYISFCTRCPQLSSVLWDPWVEI